MKTPLPKRPDGTQVNTMPLFLLRSAVQARHAVNGTGLKLRLACAVVAFIASWWARERLPLSALLFLPLFLGLGIATVEWLEAPLDRLKLHANPTVSRISNWFTSARERATANISGVLEVAIGPVVAIMAFAGPWAASMPFGARIVGLGALAIFVADTLVQVVNDAGYYNFTGAHDPTPFMVFIRRALPAVVAVVFYVLMRLTPEGMLPEWLPGALASVLLVASLVMIFADALQTSALRAYSLSLSEALIDARTRTTSDVHRLKSTIRAEGAKGQNRLIRAHGRAKDLMPDEWLAIAREELQRSMEELWLQAEMLRIQSSFPTSHLTLQQAIDSYLMALDERDQTTVTFTISPTHREVLLDPVAADVLRHLALDLVDNAWKSQAPAPDIEVRISTEPSGRVTRNWEVTISDNGPGCPIPERFPARSSTRFLQRQCESANGSLSITSTARGTIATSRFITEDLGERHTSEGFQ